MMKSAWHPSCVSDRKALFSSPTARSRTGLAPIRGAPLNGPELALLSSRCRRHVVDFTLLRNTEHASVSH